MTDQGIYCSNAFGLQLVTAPTIEPVTTDEVKAYGRIQYAAEDNDIAEKIVAARERAEANTLRALLTQRWRLTLDRFPLGVFRPLIRLPRPPAISVASVKYIDTNGVQQTMDPDDYRLITAREPAAIEPVRWFWPFTAYYTSATVEIEYDAGYGTTADKVPATIKTAVKRLALAWMENREESELQEKVQAAFDLMLVPYKHGFDFTQAFD